MGFGFFAGKILGLEGYNGDLGEYVGGAKMLSVMDYNGPL